MLGYCNVQNQDLIPHDLSSDSEVYCYVSIDDEQEKSLTVYNLGYLDSEIEIVLDLYMNVWDED